MNLKALIGGAGKYLSKGAAATREAHSILQKMKPASDVFTKLSGWSNTARRVGRITGGVTGSIAGATIGGLGVGTAGGAFAGAGIGGVLGAGGIYASSKLAKGLFFGALKYPKTTFGVGLTGINTGAFLKPVLGDKLMLTQQNRPTNPALQGISTNGPGFVSFGSSPRVRMSGSHLGATGDLTLSLYKKRHKL